MQPQFDELSIEDTEGLFQQFVFPQITRGVFSAGAPRAIIIGGQPGSGKSVFASQLLQRDSNAVFINGDDFRVFHPRYSEYLAENPLTAADRTQQVINYWIERALQECVQRRFDFLVEGTMRTVRAPLSTAQAASGAGYRITGAVVSTPSDVSLASTVFRYEEARRLGGVARYTRKESHDEAYLALPNTLDELLHSGLLDTITIGVRRSGHFALSEFAVNRFDEVIAELRSGRERLLESDEQEFVNSLLPYREHEREMRMR